MSIYILQRNKTKKTTFKVVLKKTPKDKWIIKSVLTASSKLTMKCYFNCLHINNLKVLNIDLLSLIFAVPAN